MEAPRGSGILSHTRASSSSGLGEVAGKDPRPGGSGTGSSTDSLASEVGRLSEENARYRQKIADLMGKTPSSVPPSRAASSSHIPSAYDRNTEQMRKLKRENQRLIEQNSSLERRISHSRSSASGDQLWRYKEEVRNLRGQNIELKREKEKFDRTAEYVCQKVLKIIGAARREGNFNSQLVGELKRWNEKLEDENHRLYNIIDRMQSKGNDVDDAVAEATVLSKAHNKDRDGNAAIVKELETQNVKIQEEMSKLSDQALSLQNLSSSSSGSSGPLPPRTPSNHEMDGTAPRRSRTPEKDSMKSRTLDPRRKSRAMSIDSNQTDEFEFLKLNNKKYTEEIERIGADLAFVREKVSAKIFNDGSTAEVDKLAEASARVATLEHANSRQAIEIERLMSTQSEYKSNFEAMDSMKAEYEQLEDDCLKLATEVERLTPLAERLAECETEIEGYQRKIAALESTGASSDADRKEVDRVEMQRTLAAMAAEKAVLQAELRELLEERAQLQGDLEDLDNQVRDLQDRANSASYLETELEVAKEENLSYAQEIRNLQIEKDQLKAELKEMSEQSSSSLVRATSMAKARDDEKDAEIESLRAENEDLAAKAYNHVILNVELTTLRNQVKDLQELEVNFQEQLQALKGERAILQKEVDTIPALKAEIADLEQKVYAAETQQKKREGELASMQSSPRQVELTREHEDRGRRVRDLLDQNKVLESELGRAETRLRSLQAKYDSLLRDHTQRSQQAVREQEEAESQYAVLNLALKQERAKNASMGREAAELHSLLQTAQNERRSIQARLEEVRNENARLVQRVTELDTRNEEQERTLATVLSNRELSNGHTESPVIGPESGVPSRSPFDQIPSQKGSKNKANPSANGKSDKNGFGAFFKKKSKAVETPQQEQDRHRSPSPVPLGVQQNTKQSEIRGHEVYPDQEVMDVYDQFVDSDDVDGFMTALGYKGFRSPTSPDDMKGAFASAKYVVRPELLPTLSDYQRQKAEATHDLLEAWHSAWVESLQEQGRDISNPKLMRSM